MKQKIRTEKVNIQTADLKSNASVFLFFPTAHFLKTILASRTNGTFSPTFFYTFGFCADSVHRRVFTLFHNLKNKKNGITK